MPRSNDMGWQIGQKNKMLQETNFRSKDTHTQKARGWRKIFHTNGNDRKAGVVVLISDKMDFKTKAITKDKEGHYIMIKGSIQEEDTALVKTYTSNTGASKYIKQNTNRHKGRN